jgi:hypothetical protein
MNSKPASPGLSPLAILFVALALSIGWGVRGNWGHEYGAMIPGALAAMAAVLVSGRIDWQRRIPFFAFFGAVGWSFGGSIAYMVVIAYTHSGDLQSVLFGFACLFLIGFIWGGLGGAGTALPAFLSRARLTELLLPVAAVFAAWVGQGVYFRVKFAGLRDQVEQGIITKDDLAGRLAWMDWYDTDWIAVIVAAAAVLVLAVVRRRICWGTSLILHMCAGWWLGFTLLTVGLGLHMIALHEGKSDNWSGALGMTIGVIVFLMRKREWEVLWVMIVTGFFGGLGFSGATLVKLVLVHGGFQERFFGGPVSTNWHSVLEQTFGFISGIGVAVALGYWSTRAARHSEDASLRRWAEPVCILFVMLAISYVNIVKNLDAVWLKDPRTLQDAMWGWSSHTWFNLAYLALAIAVAVPLVAHYRGREVAVLPASPLGKGQLFFIVFLWWIVVGNLSRTVPFAEQRLITEGLIHVNACLCTLLALLPATLRAAGVQPIPSLRELVKLTALSAAIGAVLVVAGEFALVRGLWGDTFAGHAGKHIRFGPDATTHEKEK